MNNKILVAEDDPQMQLAITTSLSRIGYEVTVVGNGKKALAALEQDTFSLLITDQMMPEMTGIELLETVGNSLPVIVITAYGTVNDAVSAMQKGAADFITKPFSLEELERVVERVLSVENRNERQKLKKGGKGRPIITNDPMMIKILEIVEAVARSDATILVQGESGTGKELIARLVHEASPRANQPFVAVNCAALPDTLLESELFGHEKGSFTGALNKKIGKFELAHGGTILLDEISEMDLLLQAKLLRVLQEREVDRVGGKDPIAIDVRVIATTNRNLSEEVTSGRFRSDLYYRLNVIPITLPPLRARVGDIKLLIQYFAKKSLGKVIDIPAAVMTVLEKYSWPGNIRELQNAVERAAILSNGGVPTEAHFFLEAGRDSLTLAEKIESIATLNATSDQDPKEDKRVFIRGGLTVQEMEKALILETLKTTNDNRTQAAKLLGISIRTLRNKLAEYRME